jgi:hypothetical protein
MSSINRWFRSVISQDNSYRQSQQRPLRFSGTNQNSLGYIPPNTDKQQTPSKPKRFIAGVSVAGGDEVAE